MVVEVGLSTVSVYPESTSSAFGWAKSLGYDFVEVLVGPDPASRDISRIEKLSAQRDIPVGAVHAPCLLFTQTVWGTEPWGKLKRSAEMATALGAPLVVVHPPFRWQRDYAAGFVAGIAELEESTGIDFAVENMYPWRSSGRRLPMYKPGWDPSYADYRHQTIDLSHAAVAGDDPIAMADRMGERLRHVHLTDGTDSARDEHLVPGRGIINADGFLQHLADRAFAGSIVVEINTRRVGSVSQRETDLVESLEFARRYFPAGGQ